MITANISHFSAKSYDKAKFEDLNFYLTLARKQIVVLGRKLYPSYVNRMLADEDVVAYIAYANMLADWRFDESRGLCRNTHRYNYASGCIKTIVKKQCKAPHNVSLDEQLKGFDNNRGQNLLDILIEKGNKSSEQWSAEDIQSSMEVLPQRPKEIVRMYIYDNLSFAEIGRRIGVSRERVRQIVNESMKKIKQELLNEK